MTDKIRKALESLVIYTQKEGLTPYNEIFINEATLAIKQIILDSLPEVLARGYCSKRNSHKVLDPDLIKDMIAEVKAKLEDVK